MPFYRIRALVLIFALSGCYSGEPADNTPSKNNKSNNIISANNQSSSQQQSSNHSVSNLATISDKWKLVWQDEFNGSGIDLTKWQFEVNCFGGGNDEKQCYTDRPSNAFVEQGVLNIIALKESFSGPKAQDDDPAYNVKELKTLPYTSARLRTKHQGDWTYGRFEIRAKLPHGQGTWPAIWMLPTHWRYGSWAGSGEIDIIEAVNLKTPSDDADALPEQVETRVHGTLHYGRAWPDNVYSGTAFNLPDGISPADDFHEYAIEWQKDEIRWYVDDIHFATQQESGWYTQYINEQGQLVTGDSGAPFDQQFHLIINLAIGGNWSANANEKGIDDSIFPQKLLIDYVRVYQCDISADSGKGCESIGEPAELVEGHQAPET